MSTLDLIFEELAEHPDLHKPNTDVYRQRKATARREIEAMFSSPERSEKKFGPFGEISLPYIKMGAIDSLYLFGLD